MGTSGFERRAASHPNVAQKALDEMKLIGFGNLLPYRDWLADKPWNLVWVRWFIAIALFPLVLITITTSANLAFGSIAFTCFLISAVAVVATAFHPSAHDFAVASACVSPLAANRLTASPKSIWMPCVVAIS